jgi:hypothetical protein
MIEVMKTKNLPLIIGISLPVIFIIIISVVIFTPSLFIKPQHNFIYTTEDTYYGNEKYAKTYEIKDSKIVLVPSTVQENQMLQKDAPTLYLYDVKTDSSHQISLEEAQKYTVDPGPSSPDGYTVTYEYGHDGIFELFGSRNDNDGYFISKGNGKKKINGLSSDQYSRYGRWFNLIGWIK